MTPTAATYYVTCKRDARVAWLSGPYDDHADALAMVEDVRRWANQADRWTEFDAFGTARITGAPIGRPLAYDRAVMEG